MRAEVRAAVVARQVAAIDEREAASLNRFLDEFDELDLPFTESAAITHVTGSAIVVGTRGVLLHLHKRAQIWLQPGGHVDEGETPWDGGTRETLEETGLTATHPIVGNQSEPVLIHVDVHDAPKGHLHLDLRYLLIGPDADPAPAEGESPHVEWVPWDDERLNRESLIGAIRSAQKWLAVNPQHF
jgi:8-oxo-dGTP pyrophosphatase MutT (NUDIX family)